MVKKLRKVLQVSLFVLLMVIGIITSANALLVDPSSYVATGNQTSVPDIETIIGGSPYSVTLPGLYKAEPGTTISESGDLAESYDTVFSPSTDPKGVSITYTGGDFVGPIAYLLVKDGKAGWFLYNLTSLGWNGTENISITGLYPTNGSVSHISLYGSSTPTPIPAAAWLLGSGLVGLVTIRRRKTK